MHIFVWHPTDTGISLVTASDSVFYYYLLLHFDASILCKGHGNTPKSSSFLVGI